MFFGLGKKRTEFGKWLDNEGIKQIEVEEMTGLGRATVSRMCNDDEYSPKYSTFAKVKRGINELGYEVEYDDFW